MVVGPPPGSALLYLDWSTLSETGHGSGAKETGWAVCGVSRLVLGGMLNLAPARSSVLAIACLEILVNSQNYAEAMPFFFGKAFCWFWEFSGIFWVQLQFELAAQNFFFKKKKKKLKWMYWDPIPSFPIFLLVFPIFPFWDHPLFPFLGLPLFLLGGFLLALPCPVLLWTVTSVFWALFPSMPFSHFYGYFGPIFCHFWPSPLTPGSKGGDRRAIGIGELFHPFYDKLEYASSMPSLEYLFNYQNFRDFIIFNQHQYHESWMIITWYPPWLAIAAERGAPS